MDPGAVPSPPFTAEAFLVSLPVALVHSCHPVCTRRLYINLITLPPTHLSPPPTSSPQTSITLTASYRLPPPTPRPTFATSNHLHYTYYARTLSLTHSLTPALPIFLLPSLPSIFSQNEVRRCYPRRRSHSLHGPEPATLCCK